MLNPQNTIISNSKLNLHVCPKTISMFIKTLHTLHHHPFHLTEFNSHIHTVTTVCATASTLQHFILVAV